MADVKKCDFCGKIWEPNRYGVEPAGYKISHWSLVGGTTHFDTCSDCLEKIGNFIDGLKEKKNAEN